MAAVLPATQGSAGRLTARQLTERLFKATVSDPADLAAQDLRGLDLSGLVFKRARLTGSGLTGVDLTGSDLSGTNRERVSLDRATVSRSDFSGANLEGARLRMMAVSNGLDRVAADAPRFAGANVRGAEIEARLDFADFHGADLSHAEIGRQLALWGSYKPRSVMIGCDFSHATLVGGASRSRCCGSPSSPVPTSAAATLAVPRASFGRDPAVSGRLCAGAIRRSAGPRPVLTG